MALRNFIKATAAPERVEQFTVREKTSVVVRWDFEPIKTFVAKDSGQQQPNRRRHGRRASEQATDVAGEPQGELVDTGLIAFSENRYNGIPEAEKVVADITADLDLRYGDSAARPEVDMDYYREAIAALAGD